MVRLDAPPSRKYEGRHVIIRRQSSKGVDRGMKKCRAGQSTYNMYRPARLLFDYGRLEVKDKFIASLATRENGPYLAIRL
jgi:hypothetical protein